MKRQVVTPIKTWLFWSILVLGAFLLLTWEYFVAGFSSDTSRISHLLLLFFFFGFLSSLRSAIYLQKEFNSLSEMAKKRDFNVSKPSEIACILTSVKSSLDKKEHVEVKNLLSNYGVKLGIRIRNVSVVSGVLITIGLLGTVIGLIITVGGLSTVLNSAGNNYEDMIAGMNRTVMGMGTAFYTTFFGGLLGGVVLRVLGAELEKSAAQLAVEAMDLGELWLAPLCEVRASETLLQLDAEIDSIKQGLWLLGAEVAGISEVISTGKSSLKESLSQLVLETENTIAATLEKGLGQFSDGLDAIAATLEEYQHPLKDGLDRLAGAVEDSISETRRQEQKRNKMRASDIAQKLNIAAAMIDSLYESEKDAA
jgi:hypothetical protein